MFAYSQHIHDQMSAAVTVPRVAATSLSSTGAGLHKRKANELDGVSGALKVRTATGNDSMDSIAMPIGHICVDDITRVQTVWHTVWHTFPVHSPLPVCGGAVGW